MPWPTPTAGMCRLVLSMQSLLYCRRFLGQTLTMEMSCAFDGAVFIKLPAHRLKLRIIGEHVVSNS